MAANHTVFYTNLTGKSVLKRIIQQIYPHICVLCGDAGSQNRDLCAHCEADLIINRQACQQCAIPLPSATSGSVCGQCLKKPPLYDQSWSAFIYAQPLEWMIQQLKFNARLSYSILFSELMMPLLPALHQQPDCIIPVPLHNKRIRQRGFNQTYELIKPVATKLAIKIDTKHCLRIRNTQAQTGINAKSRSRNVKDAFEFKNTPDYKYIILFDDVITTGSTINELARTLKNQGVERVDVWSLARAQKMFK